MEPIYNISIKSEEDTITTDELMMMSRSAAASHMKNKMGQSTPGTASSASSSRNNSPRTTTEAKLRQNRTTANHQAQRNSINYTSSTLQEDLMKLINPDYMQVSDDNFHAGAMNSKPTKHHQQNSHSLGNISNLASMKPSIITDDLMLVRTKSRSREGINLGHHPTSLDNFKIPKPYEEQKHLKKNHAAAAAVAASSAAGSEVIFTTARPATVISSNTQSPAPNNETVILHINEETNLSAKKNKINKMGLMGGSGGGVCVNKENMEWSSIESATRAMMQVNK